MINYMAEEASVDPKIWYDIINVTFKIGLKNVESDAPITVPKLTPDNPPNIGTAVKEYKKFAALQKNFLLEDVS